jgi:hypothetical protein
MSLISANPISEAILGRMLWTDLSVIVKWDRLFAINVKELVKYINEFRKEMIKWAIITL